MNAPDPKTPRARRTLASRKWLLVLASTLVALLSAEAGMRLLLLAKGTPYDGAALLQELERDADAVKAFTPANPGRPDSIPADRVLHPYFGAESGPDPGGVLAYFSSTPPDAAFEVLIVGGSVAMLFGQDAAADLERALAADPRLAGRPVRVLNGAHAAYKQPQQLNKVAYLFAQGYRPDVVFELDGFNEVANGLNNGLTGTNPLYPTPPFWAGLLWGRSEVEAGLAQLRARLIDLGGSYRARLASAQRLGLLHSAIGGSLIRSQLNSIQARRLALQAELAEKLDPRVLGKAQAESRELNGDSYDRSESAIIELSVRNWVECSISLKALCAARGVRYLHALQPTLWDAGSKPIADSERKLSGAKHWRRGVELGYPRLRESIPLLKAAGVDFLDLSRSFAHVEEALYFDPCHFNPNGAKLLVDGVARSILKLLP